MDHMYNYLLFSIQILRHDSNFCVTWFSYGSNTHDAMGRVSHSQTDFDMAATATFNWILAATASSRAPKPEFQYSSPTFKPRILAATMGTSTWRASPTMGNA
jgi:hypothetical protein